MTDKVQKIREEVVRLCNAGLHNSTISKKNVLNTILAVVNDFKEVPVSEDLEKAAEKYGRDTFVNECMENGSCDHHDLSDAFEAGAQWKEQQMIKVLGDWLEEHINDYVVEGKGRDIDLMFDDIKQAMK